MPLLKDCSHTPLPHMLQPDAHKKMQHLSRKERVSPEELAQAMMAEEEDDF